MAMGVALLTLALFFLGYHSDPARFDAAQRMMTIGGGVIAVGGITLGVRARRGELSPEQSFTYGRALLVGIQIGFFARLFEAIFNLGYSTVINPGFLELISEHEVAAMEAKGMSSEAIEKATGVMHIILHPGVQFIATIIVGMIFSTLISLIVAAFLKRRSQFETASPLSSP